MSAKKPAKGESESKGKGSPGRPSLFTQAIADEICEKLGEGIPLTEICAAEGMPAVRTVSDWKEAHPSFSTDFACARARGFDAIAEDCIRIADETANDTVTDEEGRERPNTEWISRSKLRVDTRLKLLAKWDPKRYGDRIAQEISGPDGGPISTAAMTLTPEQTGVVDTWISKIREKISESD